MPTYNFRHDPLHSVNADYFYSCLLSCQELLASHAARSERHEAGRNDSPANKQEGVGRAAGCVLIRTGPNESVGSVCRGLPALPVGSCLY